MHEKCEHSPSNGEPWNHKQDHKPKPKKNINFLIDNVQRHHAESIVFLDGPWRAIFVKVAFCNLWENNIQTIHNSSEVISDKVNSKCVKVAAQKFVGYVNLENDV
jgi:hypothetical protein